MQTKGIVRKIDELGRIVLPIELRKTLRIAEGDSLEITCADDGIVLKKRGQLVDREAFCRAAAEAAQEAFDREAFVFDTQKIVAVAGLARELEGSEVDTVLADCVRKNRAGTVEAAGFSAPVAVFPLRRNGELFGGLAVVGLGADGMQAGHACTAFLSRYV